MLHKESEIDRLAEKLAGLESDFNDSKAENKTFQRKIENLKHEKCELEKSAERTSVLLESLEREKADLEEKEASIIARLEYLETCLAENKAVHDNVDKFDLGCR